MGEVEGATVEEVKSNSREHILALFAIGVRAVSGKDVLERDGIFGVGRTLYIEVVKRSISRTKK